MFTKTSIALAIIVAICSGALAVEKRENGAANTYGRSAPVVAATLSLTSYKIAPESERSFEIAQRRCPNGKC